MKRVRGRRMVRVVQGYDGRMDVRAMARGWAMLHRGYTGSLDPFKSIFFFSLRLFACDGGSGSVPCLFIGRSVHE